MKIATYNVNGVNGRLPVLLRWLKEEKPDVVCLQELKAPQEKFPEQALKDAGYNALWLGQKSWNGVAILSRGNAPVETQRGLPGDPADIQSRYIEAAVDGIIIGCIYLPNGNPAPGPKFDYKLDWFKRLTKYAAELLQTDMPIVLAGDYNVIPTDMDCHKPESWKDDALFFPQSKAAYKKLVAQGWTDSLRTLYPDEIIFTFWDYFRNAYGRNAGIRIDHLLLSPQLAPLLVTAGVDRKVREWEKTSDHAPTWIELNFKTKSKSGLSKLNKTPAVKLSPAKTKVAKPVKSISEVSGIKISHPERIVYPEAGFSKQDMVLYYDAVTPYLLPYIENRLISVIRCPQTINDEKFFQRHAGLVKSTYLKSLKVKDHGDDEPYMALDNEAAVISLIQMGVVEIHPWGSKINDVYKPDRIIFDFDPDPTVGWKDVVKAAFEIKERLESFGLESFLKTTGGKGLHVVIPFKPKYDWDVMKPWAKAVADSMVADSPDRFTTNMRLVERKNKIFVDYLRNGLTSTAVAAYSLRARSGAPVSMPIQWEELTAKLDPKKYDLKTVPKILAKRQSDPWANFYKSKQTMSVQVLKKFKISY